MGARIQRPINGWETKCHYKFVFHTYLLNFASGEKGKFARCPVLSVKFYQIFQERQIISFIKVLFTKPTSPVLLVYVTLKTTPRQYLVTNRFPEPFTAIPTEMQHWIHRQSYRTSNSRFFLLSYQYYTNRLKRTPVKIELIIELLN